MPRHRSHHMTLAHQRAAQPTAHKTGRTRDQDLHADTVPDPQQPNVTNATFLADESCLTPFSALADSITCIVDFDGLRIDHVTIDDLIVGMLSATVTASIQTMSATSHGLRHTAPRTGTTYSKRDPPDG
jgi:hypothetical protein